MSPSSPEHRNAIVYDPLGVRETQTDNYQGFMSKKSNRVCLYFCAGFIMSTIFALVSYSLVHGVLTDETVEAPCGKRVVAYHDLIADREITESQLSKLTHLILLPVQVQPNGTLAFRNAAEEQKKVEKGSIDYTMEKYSYFTNQPNKLNILVEFVGRSFENVTRSQNYYQMIGLKAEVSHWVPWNDVRNWKWTVSDWDDEAKIPFFWDRSGTKLLVFEGEASLQAKITYVFERKIGGLAVRRIDYDDNHDTMLNVLSTAKQCSGNNINDVNYTCN
ncbi:unnamed protein product [Caenorhabditis nigoni]